MFSGLAVQDHPRELYTVSRPITFGLSYYFQYYSICLVLVFFVLCLPLNFFLSQVNFTSTLGTLNVAAEVEGVKVKGDGEMHMTLMSSLLPNLNRQLQFVSYTNTLFHPSTADTGEARHT